MNAEKLKQQLESHEILLFLDGDNIRFRFTGKQIPDAAKLLLDDLKQSKAEMVALLKSSMTKGRQQSLEAIMEDVVAQTLEEIAQGCNGKQFKSSEPIRKAEDNVTAIYKKVIDGEGKLDEFKNAVNKWKEISLTENTIQQ